MEQAKIKRDTSDLINQVQIGQFISVEIKNLHRDRFNTRLIGMLDGECLILELPSIVKRGEQLERLLYNNTLVIRTICEGTTGDCLGFQTQVGAIIKNPIPLFFASYPQEVVKHELRREERIDTLLPAKLHNEDRTLTVAGTITDISSGGCRLVLEGEELLSGFDTGTMRISFYSPELGGETVKGVRICSQRRKGRRGIALGLAFIEARQ